MVFLFTASSSIIGIPSKIFDAQRLLKKPGINETNLD
jgi:hypothetical protein